MHHLISLISGWRGDLSTGRSSSLVALIVAVVQEFRGAELQHVSLWLAAAFGSYGLAKGTEMVCSPKEEPTQ